MTLTRGVSRLTTTAELAAALAARYHDARPAVQAATTILTDFRTGDLLDLGVVRHHLLVDDDGRISADWRGLATRAPRVGGPANRVALRLACALADDTATVASLGVDLEALTAGESAVILRAMMIILGRGTADVGV